MVDLETRDITFVRAQLRELEGRLGPQAIALACHAALPTAITPDFLHLLRINFFVDGANPIDYETEAKLLLSGIFSEVGEGLYEINAPMRTALLERLGADYNDERRSQIASLLYRYTEGRSDSWQSITELQRAQQLNAALFVDAQTRQAAIATLDAAAAPVDPASGEGGKIFNLAWVRAMQAERDKVIKAIESGETKRLEAEREAEARRSERSVREALIQHILNAYVEPQLRPLLEPLLQVQSDKHLMYTISIQTALERHTKLLSPPFKALRDSLRPYQGGILPAVQPPDDDFGKFLADNMGPELIPPAMQAFSDVLAHFHELSEQHLGLLVILGSRLQVPFVSEACARVRFAAQVVNDQEFIGLSLEQIEHLHGVLAELTPDATLRLFNQTGYSSSSSNLSSSLSPSSISSFYESSSSANVEADQTAGDPRLLLWDAARNDWLARLIGILQDVVSDPALIEYSLAVEAYANRLRELSERETLVLEMTVDYSDDNLRSAALKVLNAQTDDEFNETISLQAACRAHPYLMSPVVDAFRQFVVGDIVTSSWPEIARYEYAPGPPLALRAGIDRNAVRILIDQSDQPDALCMVVPLLSGQMQRAEISEACDRVRYAAKVVNQQNTAGLSIEQIEYVSAALGVLNAKDLMRLCVEIGYELRESRPIDARIILWDAAQSYRLEYLLATLHELTQDEGIAECSVAVRSHPDPARALYILNHDLSHSEAWPQAHILAEQLDPLILGRLPDLLSALRSNPPAAWTLPLPRTGEDDNFLTLLASPLEGHSEELRDAVRACWDRGFDARDLPERAEDLLTFIIMLLWVAEQVPESRTYSSVQSSAFAHDNLMDWLRQTVDATQRQKALDIAIYSDDALVGRIRVMDLVHTSEAIIRELVVQDDQLTAHLAARDRQIVDVNIRYNGGIRLKTRPAQWILWVDDNPHLNEKAIAEMAARGYRVTTAVSTAEAMEIIDEHAYAVVITDTRRHRDNNAHRSLLDALLKRGIRIPVIVNTDAGGVNRLRTSERDFFAVVTANHVGLLDRVSEALILNVDAPTVLSAPRSETESLVTIVSDPSVPIQDRVVAGRRLAIIGDPRPGVGLRPDGLPDIVWCDVPAGEFIYQGGEKRTLPAFRISKYPVTSRQFQAFTAAKDGYANVGWWAGLHQEGSDQQRRGPDELLFQLPNHPRISVSWYEAMAFCRWLSSNLGMTVTLPTEQEWEKAARGTDGREYPWGNGYREAYANVDEKYNKVGQFYLRQTTPVGMYPQGASPYGVMDMSGNVWEWTLTEFESKSDTNVSSGGRRVMRGGSWNYSADVARADCRDLNLGPDDRDGHGGFRLVSVGETGGVTNADAVRNQATTGRPEGTARQPSPSVHEDAGSFAVESNDKSLIRIKALLDDGNIEEVTNGCLELPIDQFHELISEFYGSHRESVIHVLLNVVSVSDSHDLVLAASEDLAADGGISISDCRVILSRLIEVGINSDRIQEVAFELLKEHVDEELMDSGLDFVDSSLYNLPSVRTINKITVIGIDSVGDYSDALHIAGQTHVEISWYSDHAEWDEVDEVDRGSSTLPGTFSVTLHGDGIVLRSADADATSWLEGI